VLRNLLQHCANIIMKKKKKRYGATTRHLLLLDDSLSVCEKSAIVRDLCGQQYVYNYAILDVTILTSRSGYNGMRCPPWRPLRPESLFCPSPKGESFVDRPTSNSPSEGADNAREKLRPWTTPRKEMLRISSVTQFSVRCDQSTVPKNERLYIYEGVPDSSCLLSEAKKKSKFFLLYCQSGTGAQQLFIYNRLLFETRNFN